MKSSFEMFTLCYYYYFFCHFRLLVSQRRDYESTTREAHEIGIGDEFLTQKGHRPNKAQDPHKARGPLQSLIVQTQEVM